MAGGDFFEDLLGQNFPQPKKPTPGPKVEKGVRMEAKSIDGVKYVKLSDVVELLELNKVLPGTLAKFKKAL